MKTFLKLTVVASAFCVLPAIVEAQGRTPRTDSAAIGGDIGLFRPSDDQLKSGLSVDGFYEYYMTPRTSIRLGAGWTAPEYEFEEDTNLRYIRIGGDLIYNWEGGPIHPFVGAGLGVYIMEPRENGESRADSESKLGGVFLGGVELFTSDTVSIKGEVSYHLIADVENFGPRNTDGLKFSVGLKKYF